MEKKIYDKNIIYWIQIYFDWMKIHFDIIWIFSFATYQQTYTLHPQDCFNKAIWKLKIAHYNDSKKVDNVITSSYVYYFNWAQF